MAIHDVNASLIPKNDVFIDYLWYRTCQVNGYSDYRIPSHNELEKKLRCVVITTTAKEFMHESNRRNNKPLNIERWVDTLKIEFDDRCLMQDDFRWLEDNPRLRCYIWRLISHLTWTNEEVFMGFDNIPHHYIELIMPKTDTSLKHAVKMEHIDNHSVTKQDIIHFINRLINNKYEKIEFIKYIRSTSNEALKHKEMTRWLANDKKLKTEWLSEYLTSNQSGYTQLTMPDSDSRLNDLISFFDVLYILNEDKYKWVIINVKKAWNQRTYRERNKTKKQYSINMSNDIGDILDKLSLARNENKNAIIEALIRTEYEKITRS